MTLIAEFGNGMIEINTVDVPLSLHFRPEKIVNLRGICKLKGSITLHIEDRI